MFRQCCGTCYVEDPLEVFEQVNVNLCAGITSLSIVASNRTGSFASSFLATTQYHVNFNSASVCYFEMYCLGLKCDEILSGPKGCSHVKNTHPIQEDCINQRDLKTAVLGRKEEGHPAHEAVQIHSKLPESQKLNAIEGRPVQSFQGLDNPPRSTMCSYEACWRVGGGCFLVPSAYENTTTDATSWTAESKQQLVVRRNVLP